MEHRKKTELEKRLEAELLSKANGGQKGPEAEDEAGRKASGQKTGGHDAGAVCEDAGTVGADAGVQGDAGVKLERVPAGPSVDEVTAERDDLKNQLLRARAEFDNYRKRMAREAERVRKTAGEGLVRELLPVLDHLELALQHGDSNSAGLAEGVELVVKQFLDVLSRWSVEPIPALGQPFDPNVHEAVMQRESDECPAQVVVEEFQRGYRMGDLVLRPAKVVVSSGRAVTDSEEEFIEAQEMEAAPEED